MRIKSFYNFVVVFSISAVSLFAQAPKDVLPQLGKEAEGYELVYDLDISKAGANITYQQDRRAQITKPFKRVAYLLELTTADGKEQHVFVSMDAFTTDLGKVGVPTAASGASFQQKVTNMTVISNVAGVVNGVNLPGGNIEFWPNNYGTSNAAEIPNADPKTYDFGDQFAADKVDGHGSMQVHNYEAKQTVFAINCWRAGNNCELGIGNNPAVGTVAADVKPQPQPDWTFAKNGASYSYKRLRVLVK